MLNRALVAATVVTLASAPRLALCQDSTHVERALGWLATPVSAAALDGRLGQAAVASREYAPIPRIALFDIAFPKDSAEAVALAGNAVLVVTAIVQDSTELPVRRVYLGTDDLARFAAAGSHVADSTVAKTFGRYRMDALFLVPLSLLARPANLLADFAVHRQGFRVGQLSGDVPPYLVALSRGPRVPGPPSSSALWAFTRREYPDLGATLAPR